MGWQDRDYNAGREEMRAYMANPSALLQYALPLYTSRTLQIRLSFWFLISGLFQAITDFRVGFPQAIPINLAFALCLSLFHELGHRVLARMVGGNHWEWVLWPLGGMVPPTCPHTPKATFVANIGGIFASTLVMSALLLSPLVFGGGIGTIHVYIFIPIPFPVLASAPPLINYVLMNGGILCSAMILINLFPCFWFDGGRLWQSILWPKMGQWRAVRITCMAGMILAVPLLLIDLYMTNLFGLILWAMVFADCFRRRLALAHAGPGVMDEDDDSPSYNYMDTSTPPVKRKKIKKRWLTNARKRALQDQAEQAKIDAILAKVKEKGLHSLSWWEKRTLRKATERQRQHDLAERP